MTKLDPEKLGKLGDDLARVSKENAEILNHERGIAEGLAKVRREVEERYLRVGERHASDHHLGATRQ